MTGGMRLSVNILFNLCSKISVLLCMDGIYKLSGTSIPVSAINLNHNNYCYVCHITKQYAIMYSLQTVRNMHYHSCH